MGQYDISYGDKYEATKDLDKREIAKLVRADIKAAVKSGELPKATYSVTLKRFSGDVRIADVEEPGFVVHNLERLEDELREPHRYFGGPERSWMSERAAAVLDKASKILNAYNYDGSDISSDYFNVRFYGHAEFDHAYTTRMRDAATKAIEEKADARYEAINAAERAEVKADLHVDFVARLLGGES